MKTKSFFAIALQASIYISLIALLGLLLGLAYALNSLLTTAADTQTATITEPQSLTATKPVLSPTIYALPVAKEAPSLKDAPKTESPDYAKMTTRELRPLARDRKIPKWNKLNKSQLIEALSA